MSGYGIRDIVNVSYTYKKGYNGQETSLVESLTFGSDVYNYSYDIFGNITSITKNGTLYESYTYDSLNQIKTVTNGTDTWQYNYDTNGNITSITKNGTTVKTYTYGNASWKDLLTNYNGTAITYDTIGNPNNWHSGMSFTWQNGRQLQGITKGTNNYSYTYDSNGLRTSKTVNGVTTNYYTIEGTLLAETKGTDTIRYLQDNNGKHYGFIYNGTMYYYTFNLQGDVTGILDSTGVKVVEYTYDIWGKVLSVTGTLASTIGQINPIRYRGYYYDAETGFYYLQSRYYDPEVGRFLNADGQLNTDAPLGYNLFAYCENNPVNKVDPTGHMAAEAAVVATNWWNPAGWIAAAIFVVEVIVVVVVCVVDETATVVKDTVEAADNIVNTRDQSVYTLTDPNDENKVKYVGRTNNPERRAKEHKKNPSKSNYEMTVVATGLNIPEAKAFEQVLISAYTLSYLDNARREIAIGNLSGYRSNISSVIQIFEGVTEDELMNLMGR